MKKILIVVDMQNDFIDGSLGTKEAQAIVPKVRDKIEEYCKEDYTIFFTKDTHKDEYLDTLEGKYLPIEHCIHNTKGWNTPLELLTVPGMKYAYNFFMINKNTFGFMDWEIWINEQDLGSIEICGLCTDICVISNALILRALFPNTRIICDASCCAGTTSEKHKAALDVMESCQIEIVKAYKEIP